VADKTINLITTIKKRSKNSYIPAVIFKIDFETTITVNVRTAQSLEKCTEPITYWRIAQNSHSPNLPANYAEQILSFLVCQIGWFSTKSGEIIRDSCYLKASSE
jgi:hypothetical protein